MSKIAIILDIRTSASETIWIVYGQICNTDAIKQTAKSVPHAHTSCKIIDGIQRACKFTWYERPIPASCPAPAALLLLSSIGNSLMQSFSLEVKLLPLLLLLPPLSPPLLLPVLERVLLLNLPTPLGGLLGSPDIGSVLAAALPSPTSLL